MSLSDEISSLVNELGELRLQTESDSKLIDLLKSQNELKAMDLTKTKHDHEISLQALRQERDLAVRNALEISGLIENMGHMALAGLRRFRGDQTPAEIPEAADRSQDRRPPHRSRAVLQGRA